MNRKIIRHMSKNGRVVRLKLFAVQWFQHGMIDEKMFLHQFERITRIMSAIGLPEHDTAEETLKLVKERMA